VKIIKTFVFLLGTIFILTPSEAGDFNPQSFQQLPQIENESIKDSISDSVKEGDIQHQDLDIEIPPGLIEEMNQQVEQIIEVEQEPQGTAGSQGE
jgi:hypothetical protein